MADQTTLDRSRHFLIESFASGGGDAGRAEMLGNQLAQLLLMKHNGETSAEFREDVRTYGLAMKKDNVQLRDMLMFNEADLKTVVDNGIDGLRTREQKQERAEIQAEATREVVGVDDMHPEVRDEDRGEGEIKGMYQPKIAGLEGIEFDTGNG